MEAIVERLKKELIVLKKEKYSFSRELDKAGGPLRFATNIANKFVTTLYNSTFSVGDSGGFAIPFITSFCSHARDNSYERENGLLSQWRGYGGNERYALVFDTQGLTALQEQEREKGYYATIGMMDVVYNDEKFDCRLRFPKLMESITRDVMSDLKKAEVDAFSDELFLYFVSAASRFKHRAFKEEREVRIVPFIHRKEYVERLFKENGIASPNIPYKKTQFYNGIERVYLFERSEKKLPIKRIIIGPNKNATFLVEKVRGLTGNKIKMVISETPLI